MSTEDKLFIIVILISSILYYLFGFPVFWAIGAGMSTGIIFWIVFYVIPKGVKKLIAHTKTTEEKQ